MSKLKASNRLLSLPEPSGVRGRHSPKARAPAPSATSGAGSVDNGHRALRHIDMPAPLTTTRRYPPVVTASESGRRVWERSYYPELVGF